MKDMDIQTIRIIATDSYYSEIIESEGMLCVKAPTDREYSEEEKCGFWERIIPFIRDHKIGLTLTRLMSEEDVKNPEDYGKGVVNVNLKRFESQYFEHFMYYPVLIKRGSSFYLQDETAVNINNNFEETIDSLSLYGVEFDRSQRERILPNENLVGFTIFIQISSITGICFKEK